MIIFDLKYVEAVPVKNQKAHWYFRLVLQAGPGTISMPGWRYYPDTDFLRPPQRPLRGGKIIPALNADKRANAAIRELVLEVISLQVVELDSVLARLKEMDDSERKERLDALRNDSYAGAAVVWTWEKGRH